MSTDTAAVLAMCDEVDASLARADKTQVAVDRLNGDVGRLHINVTVAEQAKSRALARADEAEVALTEEIANRDRAQDALLDASTAMGGPEWTSDHDLHAIVPQMCADLWTRAEEAEAQRDAVREALAEAVVFTDRRGEWGLRDKLRRPRSRVVTLARRALEADGYLRGRHEGLLYSGPIPRNPRTCRDCPAHPPASLILGCVERACPGSMADEASFRTSGIGEFAALEAATESRRA